MAPSCTRTLHIAWLVAWAGSVVHAQPRPDETEADYQRRTLEEAREAARREDAGRADAAGSNQAGGSYADQLGRQYADQWAQQAAMEKEQEAARKRAQQQLEHERARQREEAAQAARLRFVLNTLAEKQRLAWMGERVSIGFSTSLNRFRTGKADADDLLKLLMFASWFPQQAEESGASRFLQTIGGEDLRQRAYIALDRVLAEGNILPLWHCALLDADPEGRYGVGELFGRWVQANFSPSVEPEYWLLNEQVEAGLISSWDAQLWRFDDPYEVEQVVMQWNDLPGATTETGFVFAGPATEPVLVSSEQLDPAKRERVPALDVLASAICGGAFGDEFRSELWRPNVERVRAWSPAYADVLEVYIRRYEDWERTPIELEVLLLRALAAGGRPAVFVEPFLEGPRESRRLLAHRIVASKNDEAVRQRLETEVKSYPDTLLDEWESLVFRPGAEPLPDGFLEAWAEYRQRDFPLEQIIHKLEAGDEEAVSFATRQAIVQSGKWLYPMGQLTPGSEASRKAMGVLQAMAPLRRAVPSDLSLQWRQLRLGVALDHRESIVSAASSLAEQPDAELCKAYADGVQALALAFVGPYGLTVDRLRIEMWVQTVLDQEGVVHPSLRPYLAQEELIPGSEPWVRRVRTLRNNFDPASVQPHAIDEAWRLYQTGVGLDDSFSIDARVIGYALLGMLADLKSPIALKELARIQESGSLDEKALAMCGDYYVADAYIIADLLGEKSLAGDAVAQRALEFWILLDKLTLDDVVTTYLKVLPPSSVGAVEAWMRRQPQQ